jgi:ArsR family transcriptional regulator, arsenate/arsenite/antimonite-responsive transcriptional repressor / arsenate reductase (thioredoxin)
MVFVAAASSPAVLGMLAHDLRWTIVSLLADGDLRTGELVTRTGQAPSLVSYHLGRLRDAGLVSVRRSTADGRDSYHVLDLGAVGQALGAMAAQLHPGLLAEARDLVRAADMPDARAGRRLARAGGREALGGEAPRADTALFICSGNSARSPMAAGWLNHLGGGKVTARSAGIAPAPLHPLAVAAMAEHGVDISGHQPTSLEDFAGHRFARVITLCDRAREACGEPPAGSAAVHWSIPNPAQAHPPDLDAFRATARELRTRIRHLLPVLSAGSRVR